VRVVADTHALIWYLLDALEDAAVTDGVVVSIASVVDLWYVVRTRQSLTDDQLGELVGLLHDPSSPLAAAPVTLEVAAAFQRIPRDALGDPWDRFISATAMALELPLITRDRKMTELDLVETIW
jgi:PIN domain nuclease of toxin-antitoxin system